MFSPSKNRPWRGVRWLMLLLSLSALWLSPLARGQEPDAELAFTSATKLFQGGWHDQAEKALAAFLTGFPQSTNRSEAVLLQAQSRFQIKDYPGVITLLESQMSAAGAWRDQYLYWLAHAQSQLEQFEAAAATYAELLKECPASALRLESSYGEAFARFKLGDTARTVDLLSAPSSAFQESSKGNTNETVLVRGNFLLAEALYAQKNFQAAEQTLTDLAQRGLGPESEWHRQYLLAQIELADRRGDSALLRVTNLVTLATSQSNALLQARSLTLQGEILEEKQPREAARAYESIARLPGAAADQKRQALLKVVDLAITHNRLTNAIERLDTFLNQSPQDPAVDLMRLTLGEVYIRQFHAVLGGTNLPVNTALATNLLHHARGHFDQIIHHLTNSPYVGKASLNRAWCLWEEAQLLADANKLVECQKAFQTAIDRLPKSLEQAQARFKLADCYARLKDYQTALTHYHLVLESYADVPEAREKLLDHAWYQVLRARIEMKDLPGAEAALERILQDYRSGAWGDHALLQYGKALLEAGEFAKGQETLAQLKKLFPESALLPESQLAVAGSFAKQSNWPAAIQGFTEWLARFTNHVARSQTEFDRAWCFYQSGNQTNAFQLFTNLVHQYPGSPSTPLAQLWVADHYFNQRDYQTAEIYYQLVSTNAAPVELTQHASLMAAKAAFFRTAYSDARKYLTQLVSGQVHPEVGPEAWFMLGDIELEESRVSTNKLARFEEAINYFERVTKFHAASRHAPLAMGKIAHCHFLLGTQNPNRYEMATNQYVQLLSAATDVPTRSEAEVALGRVLEKMAEQRPNRTDLLNAALDHYLNVVYGNRLKKGEDPDPYWVSRAALAAGTLAVDQLQLFDRAERLYESMQVHLPALRAEWDKRLQKLRQQRSK